MVRIKLIQQILSQIVVDKNIRTINRSQTAFIHRVVHMDLGRHDIFYGNVSNQQTKDTNNPRPLRVIFNG